MQCAGLRATPVRSPLGLRRVCVPRFLRTSTTMSSSAMLAHKGFDGVIQGATLADLIQMECLALTTRAVRVDGVGRTGRLFFTGGQVVHAEVGDLKGELALFEMIRWSTGSFTIEEGVRPMDE